MMNSCGTNLVVFHPLTSFEVKTRTIFDIKKNREMKNIYAKLSDEGSVVPKTLQIDIENI